jgi:D-3-phosphoglycerate dehydrogenase
VGFGRIGREVSALGQAFGMRVVAWSRSPITQPPEGIEVVPTLAELAVCSDVVSVHTAPSPDGPLLDAAFFNAMNMGSIFINVARGGVVDEEALLNAIEVRALRVGTDVFEGEPSGGEAAFDSPLAQHPSVVATHHVGAATVQAQEAVAEVLVQIIDVYSTSAQVMNAVAV